MIVLFGVISVFTTFVIAAVSIGGVTARMASRSRRTVYDFEQAVDFIADRLPPELTAQISYDDVSTVVELYLRHLMEKGVASGKTSDDPGELLVLVDEEHRLAWVLGQLDELPAGAAGSELTDEQVAAILATNAEYERSIGAIGPEVADDGSTE